MKPLEEILQREKLPMPCLFYPAARELGYTIEEILTDAEKQKELLLHIADDYLVGAVVRMTELWCEAAAFGMKVTFPERNFPKLGVPIYQEPEDLQNAVIPKVRNSVTAPLIDAVKMAVPELRKPLVVGTTGPYTLGSVLNGSENFMMNCIMEPDIVEEFLERVTEFLIAYILEYKKAGASAVMIAEPSTAMISPDMMDEFSNTYLNRIVKETADDTFTVLYHNCGAVNRHLDTIAELGVDGFHFGSQVDLEEALELIGSEKPVMGNIEPQLFLGNHPEDIQKKREEILELQEENDNLILSTGCDLSPAADLKAIRKAFAV